MKRKATISWIKEYVDFTRLHKLHGSGANFVTCVKENMRFRRMYSREFDKQPE